MFWQFLRGVCEQQNESLRDEIINSLCVKTLNTEHILYFWKNDTIKYSKLAKSCKNSFMRFCDSIWVSEKL
jgi:hypothetical protein